MHLRPIELGIATLLFALAPAFPQAVPSQRPPAALSASDTVEVIREIDDPSTGDRWLLVRDWSRPGGPGRLLLLAGSLRPAQRAPGPAQSAAAGEPGFIAPAAPVIHAPIIHANDLLIVEENTPLVEARLAASALGPAARGAVFEARLEIGGKIVRVRAVGPGRATLDPGLAPESGGQP
jgi:hypothetical protein